MNQEPEKEPDSEVIESHIVVRKGWSTGLPRYEVMRHRFYKSTRSVFVVHLRSFLKEKNAIACARGLTDGTWIEEGPIVYFSLKPVTLDD
jgi:hypothetical protein